MAQAKKALKALQNFNWEGTNKKGEKVKGETSGASVALVKAELRRQGIKPTKVAKKSALFGPSKKKIKTADIATFSRQLATMMSSGIPLTQSVEIIARGATNPSLQEMLLQVKASIESGDSLAEALAKHPEHFNELFINLTQAGEQSGSLEIMLDKIATYREKLEAIKSKIKKALFYPVAVVVIAFVITAGILIFIVPQFEEMFKSFGADLPGFTQMVVDASRYFQKYWWIVLLVIVGAIYGFKHGLKNSKKFAFFVDQKILKLPIFGVILQKAAIARFCRTLSTTFAAGLPLVDALLSVSGATGNLVFSKATLYIRDEVQMGTQIQIAMANTGLFPNMVIQMVAIGEESGALEKMLSKVADFYEAQVDDAVEGLSSLLEPLIMVILGTLIGGVVVAMYLPIFKLGTVM